MRLFVAADVAPGLLDDAIRAVRALHVPNCELRVQKPEQIHFTLKFIGEATNSTLDEIKQVVSDVGKNNKALTFCLDQWLVIPAKGPARIVGLSASVCPPSLKAFAKDLNDEFENIGFKGEDREFLAHLTLARVKYDDSKGKLRKGVMQLPLSKIDVPINELILYRSHLEQSGARYEKLMSSVLGR